MSWSRPFVRYDNFFSNRPDRTPADLVEILTTTPEPKCDPASCLGKECNFKKSRGSWSPVSLKEGSTRSNDAVESVNYFVADLDHMTDDALATVLASIAGYAHVVYSTHNHAPPLEGSYRLVMALSRSVVPAEWKAVRTGIVRALELPIDPNTKDLSRLYALPDVRTGCPFYTTQADGVALEVDEALQVAGQPAAKAPTSPPIAPEVYDLGALRDLLAAPRRSKASSTDEKKREQAEILARILEGRPLAKVGERDAVILRSAGLLAYWLPANTPWEVVAEILRPSLTAMLTAEPDERGLDYMFDVAAKKYARQMESRNAADAQRAVEKAKLGELKARLAGKSVTAAAFALADAPNADPDAWKSALVEAKGGYRGNELNAQILIGCDPEIRDTLKWNTLSQSVAVVGGPFAGASEETLDGQLTAWLQLKHGFLGGEGLVSRAIPVIAQNNPFHPVRDYLDTLRCDGEARIERAVAEAFGAEPTPLNAALIRKWFVGAVARAHEPGCKLDTMLVLEGDQGAGKSTALRILAGDEFFVDTPIDVRSKDGYSKLRGKWIVEWQELESIRRADQSAVKAFLSSSTDRYRQSYARNDHDYPRACVFAGTTNHAEFLSDETGDRRYWPVKVGEINLGLLREWRDQLWAEATQMYLEGKASGVDCLWHLDDAEKALLEAVHAQHRVIDAWADPILSWMDRPVRMTFGDADAPKVATEFVVRTTANVLRYALEKRDVGSWRPQDEHRVAKILRQAGWRQDPNARPRVWVKAGAATGILKAV